MTSELRLKDLGRWRSGGTPPKDRYDMWDGEVPWLSAKDFDRGTIREPTVSITEAAARAHSQVAAAGSVLIIVRGMALVHGLPVVITDRRVAFNQDLRALEVGNGFEPRYVYYALRGHRHRLNAHIDRAAHGTARVSDSIYRERLPIPLKTEQAAIADFLDRECERIRAIGGLLADHRTAGIELERRVIDDLFVEVPLTRLGWRASIQSGLTLGGKYVDEELAEYPYLRVANVQANAIATTDVARVRVPARIARRTTLRRGDVLMTEGGDIDKLGRGAVWDGSIPDCLHQNHVFAARVLGCLDAVVRCAFLLRAHREPHQQYRLHEPNQARAAAGTRPTGCGSASEVARVRSRAPSHH